MSLTGLVICPECEREVSDDAVKCPRCGVTLPKPLPEKGLFATLAGLFRKKSKPE